MAHFDTRRKYKCYCSFTRKNPCQWYIDWCDVLVFQKEGCVLWLVWLKKFFFVKRIDRVSNVLLLFGRTYFLDNFWLIWCRTTSFWLFFLKDTFTEYIGRYKSLFYQIKIKVQWKTKDFGLPKKTTWQRHWFEGLILIAGNTQ